MNNYCTEININISAIKIQGNFLKMLILSHFNVYIILFKFKLLEFLSLLEDTIFLNT